MQQSSARRHCAHVHRLLEGSRSARPGRHPGLLRLGARILPLSSMPPMRSEGIAHPSLRMPAHRLRHPRDGASATPRPVIAGNAVSLPDRHHGDRPVRDENEFRSKVRWHYSHMRIVPICRARGRLLGAPIARVTTRLTPVGDSAAAARGGPHSSPSWYASAAARTHSAACARHTAPGTPGAVWE